MTPSPIPLIPLKSQGPSHPTVSSTDSRLMDAAKKLEATFLSEMFKSAGLGESRDAFGGGAGEGHFASFLRGYQTEHMVDAGGIGLAQSLFEAMKVKMDTVS